jgi:hypothetical protein
VLFRKREEDQLKQLRDENSRREMESALDKPTDQVTF